MSSEIRLYFIRFESKRFFILFFTRKKTPKLPFGMIFQFVRFLKRICFTSLTYFGFVGIGLLMTEMWAIWMCHCIVDLCRSISNVFSGLSVQIKESRQMHEYIYILNTDRLKPKRYAGSTMTSHWNGLRGLGTSEREFDTHIHLFCLFLSAFIILMEHESQ